MRASINEDAGVAVELAVGTVVHPAALMAARIRRARIGV